MCEVSALVSGLGKDTCGHWCARLVARHMSSAVPPGPECHCKPLGCQLHYHPFREKFLAAGTDPLLCYVCVTGCRNFARACESDLHAEQICATTPARNSCGTRGANVQSHLACIAEPLLCRITSGTSWNCHRKGWSCVSTLLGLTCKGGAQVETHVFTAEPSDTYNALQRNSQKLASDLEAVGFHVVSSRASIVVCLLHLWAFY